MRCARRAAAPLVDALRETASIPNGDRWAMFLRNNDELDLGRLSDEDRALVFRTFARSPRMQLYGRGIRRRLAPMLGGDRARLELAFALLLSLPGTPVLFYGDEIGMGDDLALDERDAVRTPMQWSAAQNGGFSGATRRQLPLPVIARGPFGHRYVNVSDQRRDPQSLLQFVQSAIGHRRQFPEYAEGSWETVRAHEPSVFALRYRSDESQLLAVHNLSPSPVSAGGLGADGLEDAFSNRDYGKPTRRLELDGYGFRWLRPADEA